MATQAELNQQAVARVRSQLQLEILTRLDGMRTRINGNQFELETDMVLTGNVIGVIKAVGNIYYNLTIENSRVVGADVKLRVDRVEYNRNSIEAWGNQLPANFRMVIQGQEVFSIDYDPIAGGSFTKQINKTVNYPTTVPIHSRNNSSPYLPFGNIFDTWESAPTSGGVLFRLTVPDESITRVETAPKNGTIYIAFQDTDNPIGFIKDEVVIRNVPIGSTYNYTVPDIPGYTKLTSDRRVIFVNQENNYVTILYSKNPSTVTIEGRLRGSGTPMVSTKQIYLKEGQTHKETLTDINYGFAGKIYPENPNLSVTGTGKDQTIIVWYKQYPFLDVNYLDDATGEPITGGKRTQLTIKSGNHTEIAKVVDGYRVKGSNTQTLTVSSEGNNNITFRYTKIPTTGTVTIKYLNKSGTVIHTENKTVELNKLFSYTAPNTYNGNRLISPATKKITPREGRTPVFIYAYEPIPIKANVTVKYLDRATNKPVYKERVLTDQNIGSEIAQPARPVANYEPEQGTIKHIVVEGDNTIIFYYRQVAKIRPWAIRKSDTWKSLTTQNQWMKIRRNANQNYWDTKSNAEIFPSEVNKDNFSASRIRKSGVWKSQGRIGQ